MLPEEGLKAIVAKKLSKIKQNKYYKKQIKKNNIQTNQKITYEEYHKSTNFKTENYHE